MPIIWRPQGFMAVKSQLEKAILKSDARLKQTPADAPVGLTEIKFL
jgi:hypothetical protein